MCATTTATDANRIISFHSLRVNMSQCFIVSKIAVVFYCTLNLIGYTFSFVSLASQHPTFCSLFHQQPSPAFSVATHCNHNGSLSFWGKLSGEIDLSMSCSISALVTDVALRVRGVSFDSRAGQTRRSVATAAMFFRSCVVQALSSGNRSRDSSDASA